MHMVASAGKGGPSPGEPIEPGLDLVHIPQKGVFFNSLIHGAPEVQYVGFKQRGEPIKTMDELELNSTLKKNLKDWNVGEVTIVQRYMLPAVMGHDGDIWCKAPTGTGKTFAYIVALLQRLVDNKLSQLMGSLELSDESGEKLGKGKGSRKGRPKLGLPLMPLALIVQPTREQAHQTFHHLCHLAKGLNLAIGYDIGRMELKCWSLHGRDISEVDILVGTPGRLSMPDRWSGKRLQVVLLDDGDKLFHDDFNRFRKALMPRLRPEAVRVVLSAAFPRDVQKNRVAKFLRPRFSSLNVRLVLTGCKEGTRRRNHYGPDAMPGYVSSINLVTQEFLLPGKLVDGLGEEDLAKLTIPNRNSAFDLREKDALLLSVLSDELVKRKEEQQKDRKKPPISIMVFMERVDQVERVEYHRNMPYRSVCKDYHCWDNLSDDYHWGSQRGDRKPELASRLFHHLQRHLADWEQGKREDVTEKQVPLKLHHPQPYTWLHRRLPQAMRSQHIKAFLEKRTPIMVCTSVAARGIDLPIVDLVINYDMAAQFDGRKIVNLGATGISVSEMRTSPIVQKALGIHVQRIGRAGRVGHAGRAVSFFDPKKDTGLINSLVRDILAPLDQDVPDWMLEWLGQKERLVPSSDDKWE